MEKEIRSNSINLSLVDYALIITYNLFLFFLLYRNEKYVWGFFAIIAMAYLVYRIPELLLAVSVQLINVIKYFLDNLHVSSVNRSLMIFGLVFLGLFFFKGLNRSLFSLLKQPLFILITLFSVLWLFSLSNTPTPRYGQQKVVLHILFNLPILLQFVIFNLDLESYVRFFRVAVVFTLLFSINSIIHILLEGLGGQFTILNYFEINPIWVGRLYGFGIIAASLCWHYSKLSTKRYYIFAAILFFILMIIVGKRGPLLSLFIVFFLMYLFRKESLFKKNSYVYTPIILLILFVGFYWRELIDIATGFMGVETSRLSIVYRIFMLQIFIKVISSMSLMGLGAGSFSKLSAGQDMRWYPHNIFIETTLEAGIITGLILIVIFFIIIKEFLLMRNQYIHNKQIFELMLHSTATFVFGLINSQFSGDLFTNRYIWVGLGLHIGIMLKERSNSIEKQDANFN